MLCHRRLSPYFLTRLNLFKIFLWFCIVLAQDFFTMLLVAIFSISFSSPWLHKRITSEHTLLSRLHMTHVLVTCSVWLTMWGVPISLFTSNKRRTIWADPLLSRLAPNFPMPRGMIKRPVHWSKNIVMSRSLLMFDVLVQCNYTSWL